MGSEAVAIADAVANALTAATLSQDFTAARDYVPSNTLEELAELKVTVLVAGRRRTRLSRADWRVEYDVDVGVQLKLATATLKADADAMMYLVEEIADFFSGQLTGYTEAKFESSVINPQYAPDHLTAKEVFSGVARLTFVVFR